jgi:uncharacterized protein YndB with AHSA1/START domain
VTPRAFEKSVVLDAPPEQVWAALTTPQQMTEWMGHSQMQLEIITDWGVGAPFTLRGVLNGRFENTGTVLRFEPPAVLSYSHLSSHSQLPGEPDSYSVLEFRLTPLEPGSSLTLHVSGFPTEVIYKHLDFYWRGALDALKRHVEGQP